MVNCEHCGKDVDNLAIHKNQFHDAVELSNYANEEIEYTGGDFCAKCGTEFEDRGECKVCNKSEEAKIGGFDDDRINISYGYGNDVKNIDDMEEEGDEADRYPQELHQSEDEWEKELGGLRDKYAGEEEDDEEEDLHHGGGYAEPGQVFYSNTKPVEVDEVVGEDDPDFQEWKKWNDSSDQEKQEYSDNLVDTLHAEEDATQTNDDGSDTNTPMIPDVDFQDTEEGKIFKMGESWDINYTFNNKVDAFESLGIPQGDSLKLAELSWYDLSTEVQKALVEVEEEEKDEHRDSSNDAAKDEGAGDGADQPKPSIDEGYDYNNIGINRNARSKYECEHCSSGFKSSEALMTHYNELHVSASEFLLEVPNSCQLCGAELQPEESMSEHMAYDHGINLDSVTQDGMVQDGGYEVKKKNDKIKISEARVKAHEFMLDPATTPITTCIICGRDSDNHSNPNTDYRGMRGDAPPTDHYFSGGDLDGSHGFESRAQEVIINCPECGWSGINSEIDNFCPNCGIQLIDNKNLVDDLGYLPNTSESWEPHVFEATEAISYVSEFDEDKINRDDDGKFTSKGGGSGDGSSNGIEQNDYDRLLDAVSSGEPVPEDLKDLDKKLKTSTKVTNKFSNVSEKDLIKQIKGDSKDWKDWGRSPENEELYAEIERRNQEVPKPQRPEGAGGTIFRDDPNAVSKMEQKIKYLEDVQDYWKKITKFPSRDYKTPGQLGDAKWYSLTSASTNLREAKKKLESIKAQQDRGTQLVRKPTYKDGSKRFYYSEEPKGESLATEDGGWTDPAGYYHTPDEVAAGAMDTWDQYDEHSRAQLSYLRGEDDFDDERIRRIKANPSDEWMGEDTWKSQDFGWQAGGETNPNHGEEVEFTGSGPDWCAQCGRTMRDKGSCKYCDKAEEYQTDYDDFKCDKCGQQFASNADIVEHWENEHNYDISTGEFE